MHYTTNNSIGYVPLVGGTYSGSENAGAYSYASETIWDFGNEYAGGAWCGEEPRFNMFTRAVHYVRPALSIGSADRRISAALVYDSEMKPGVSVLSAGMPHGWKLDAHRFLVREGDEDNCIYKYIDGDGCVHRFVPFERDSDRYYDAEGLGYILTPADGIIEDLRGNRMLFEEGRIAWQTAGNSSKTKTVYEYDDAGRLTRIYDGTSGTSSPTEYLQLSYADGLLQSISAVRSGVTCAAIQYSCSAGRLASATAVAADATATQLYRCIYTADDKISLMIDSRTGAAVQTTYGGDGTAQEIRTGYVSENDVFTQKRAWGRAKCNYQSDSRPKVCEFLMRDEKNVITAYEYNGRGRMIGAYECNAQNTQYKTLTRERGVSVGINSSSENQTDVSINGEAAYKFTDTLTLCGTDPRLTGETDYRYYDLTFHLKHRCDAARLRATLMCSLSDDSTTSSTVDVDASAYGAWQSVSIPVDMRNTTNTITGMTLTLSAPDAESTGESVACDFRIAAGAKRSVKFVCRNGAELDWRDITAMTVWYAGAYKNYYMGGNTYMTAEEIIGAAIEANSPRMSPLGKYITLSGGEKRDSGVTAIVYTGEAGTFDLEDLYAGISTDKKIICESISPDNRSRTREYISMTTGGVYTHTETTVCTDKDKTLGDADDDYIFTGTNAVKVTDYYGNVLSETDAYGVKKEYTYDGYGNRLTAKLVGGSGGTIVLEADTYDASGYLTSRHGTASGEDYTYDLPYGTINTIYDKNRSTGGAYSRSGGSTQYGYDALYENVNNVYERDENNTLWKRVSYEYSNGIVNVVSDGMSKYGITPDIANDKIAYGVYDNGENTEYLAEEIERNTNSTVHRYYRGSATDTVTVSTNNYGKTTGISGNGSSVTYSYGAGGASGYAGRLEYINDGYSGRTYNYFYDHADNVCEWKINNKLNVRQISNTETEYTIGTGYRFITEVNYDTAQTVNPRVISSKLKVDNSNSGNVTDAITCGANYVYDEYGRIKAKHADVYVGNRYPIYTAYGYGNGNAPFVQSKTTSFDGVGNTSDASRVLTETRTYDNHGRVIGVVRKAEGQYATTETENYTETESYTYDVLGRLKTESNGIMGVNRTYTYAVGYAGARITDVTDNGIGKYYFYDLRGRLAKISSASDGTGTQTLYTYDNYGNRISDGNRNYTWTRGRLLASAGSATYTYDHNGIRSKKVYGGKTTEYLYDGGKLLHESGGDNTITYFYDVEGINAASIDEQYLIVVTDLDGSVRYIAGSVGQIIAQYKYDAYGRCKVYKQDNTEDTDMSSLGNRFPLRWKGYYYDRETGLYYADGRYYDPEVGQYLDAIEIPEAISEKYLDRNGILCDNILELMPYMYSVLVNMAKDPACTDTEEGIPWWAWLVGAAIVIGASLITAAIAAGIGYIAGTMGLIGSTAIVAGKNMALSTGFNAFLGGIIAGGINLAAQALGGNLNYVNLAVNTFTGAISGGFGGSALSVSWQIAINAMLGGISYSTIKAINKQPINSDELFGSIVWGAFAGIIGGHGMMISGGNVASSAFWNELMPGSIIYANEFIRTCFKEIWRGFIKNSIWSIIIEILSN